MPKESDKPPVIYTNKCGGDGGGEGREEGDGRFPRLPPRFLHLPKPAVTTPALGIRTGYLYRTVLFNDLFPFNECKCCSLA